MGLMQPARRDWRVLASKRRALIERYMAKGASRRKAELCASRKLRRK